MRVTQKDVAKAAGVHPSAVSAALRGASNIPESTRSHIRAVARELDYRPDPMLKALARYRARDTHAGEHRNTILVLGEQLSASESARRIFRESFVKGIEDQANATGLGVEFIGVGKNGISVKRVREILASRGFPPVIVGSFHQQLGIESLDWSRFVAVAFGYGQTDFPVHRVVHNHANSIKQCLQQAKRRGYRRIGFVASDESMKRVEGQPLCHFLYERRLLQLDEDVTPFVGDSTDTGALRRWARKYRPDVILTNSQETIETFDSADIRPEARINFNLRKSDDEYTGIYQNYEALGSQAVSLLFSHLTRGNWGPPDCPTTVMVAGQWNEGRTLPLLEIPAAR